MRLSRARRFSALLSPAGVHVVEYRQGARGVQLVSHRHRPLEKPSVDAAVEALAELVEALGGRSGELAVALTGFGSIHHILTLPDAPRDVLAPVVLRELRRFYPGLFGAGDGAPVVDFVPIHSPAGDRAGAQRELLVAALPRPLVETLHGTLAARQIRLHHLTILPQAMMRLYELYHAPGETAVAVVMVPRWPLVGFFHEGEIRLFSEPLLGEPDHGPEVIQVVLEQVGRGALFLRQQFRGVAVSRVLLAAEPDEAAPLRTGLAELLRAPVEPLELSGAGPGALAALGAALGARGEEDEFNLLPRALRPPSSAQRRARRLAVASAVLLAAAGALWAGNGLRAESRAERRLAELSAEVAAEAPRLRAMAATVRERQAHTQRAVALTTLAEDHAALTELLWMLASAAPAVDVTGVRLDREGEGWAGSIQGVALAGTSSAATDAVDRLYRELVRAFPSGEVRLSRLGYVEPETPEAGEEPVPAPDAPIAIAFEIALIGAVSAPPE